MRPVAESASGTPTHWSTRKRKAETDLRANGQAGGQRHRAQREASAALAREESRTREKYTGCRKICTGCKCDLDWVQELAARAQDAADKHRKYLGTGKPPCGTGTKKRKRNRRTVPLAWIPFQTGRSRTGIGSNQRTTTFCDWCKPLTVVTRTT